MTDIIKLATEPYKPKTLLDKVVYVLHKLCSNSLTLEQAATEIMALLVPTPSDPAQPMQSNCSVCADKDREIEKWKKDHKDLLDIYMILESELAESKRRVAELEDTWTGKENGLPKPK